MRLSFLNTRRGFVFTAAGVLVSCTREKQNTAPVKTYKMTGEVRRLEPDRMTAVIKHDDIEGWMEAMTMEFPVRDKAEFAKLAEGKRIAATVHVQELDYWISDIQVQ